MPDRQLIGERTATAAPREGCDRPARPGPGHAPGGRGRCAACDRITPDDPSVVAIVAGEPVGYLCAACPPWDEDELFRPFAARVGERYAGLPIAFVFRPSRGGP